MTDDDLEKPEVSLVKRLRDVDHLCVEDCFLQSPLYTYAADRIEQLVATNEALERERDELQKDFDGLDAASRTLINEARSIAEAAESRLAECEARLGKAVEALRSFSYEIDMPAMADDRHISIHATMGDHRRARAVLAEIESSEAVTPYGLEGGKDD
jgi:hypothetical protein